MTPQDFAAAIAAARRYLASEKVVETAILYGSAARGEAQDDSDIDIILVLSDPRTERRVAEALRDICDEHDVPVSVLAVDSALGQLDLHMRDEVLRQGVPLKGKMPPATLEDLRLRPMRIIRYTLRGLPPRLKSKLAAALFGYETRKKVGRRRYVTRRRGLVAEVGGRRLGSGAILVPEAKVRIVERVLREHRAKRMLIPVWIQET